VEQSTILSRGEQVTYEVVADEAILIDMASGTYFSLNEVGTVFWEALDGRRTLAQIATRIAKAYARKATEFVAALQAVETEDAPVSLKKLTEKFGVDDELTRSCYKRVKAGEGDAVIAELSAPEEMVLADIQELAENLAAENLVSTV